jgi:hypothetical protein
MTPREFVIWLKGFIQAANNFSATPKQWDDIKDQLNKVELDDRLQEIKRYTIDKNSSVSLSNLGLAESNSTTTYGRPEDSITYTTN